jgi:hypothetical protein
MKRVARLLLIIAVVTSGAWFSLHILRHREAGKWKALPGGGEVRFVTATKGPRHQLDLPGPSFSERVRDAVRMRTLNPFTQLSRNGPSNPSNDFGVWLEMRGKQQFNSPETGAIFLSDGRKIVTGGGESNGGPPGTCNYACSRFPYTPVREKTVRYTCTLGGKQFEFIFKNPNYRNDLPVWKGSSLPQTQRNEDLALTLRGLTIERSPSYMLRDSRSEWTAKPSWSITKAGQNADRWFGVGDAYEDPSGQRVYDCGLFAEPVWKVIGNASRTNEYPFPDDEVAWLGTATPDAPAPETYQLFPDKASGLSLAGMFGPGQYWIQGNQVVKTKPVDEVDPKGLPRFKDDFLTRTMQVTLPKPAVVIVGSAFLVCRDSNGRPAELADDYGHAGTLSINTYRLPKAPIRIGTASPGSWKFEFLVPAPPKPVLK